MKKWEKEILAKQISNEIEVVTRLEMVYSKALDDINEKIQVLKSKDQIQSVIYQLKYQEELKKQVESVYNKLAMTWYDTIDKYLKDCYEDSFYSTMYALHQEGIPVIIPFNQKEVAQASAQDAFYFGNVLSQKLYENTYKVARFTFSNIAKGIAMNESYATIAANIAKRASISMNNAIRIVRTESHRITNEVKQKTMVQAKNKTGADIVKQWDSTLDGRTRSTHVDLDGQLRELEQPFKSSSGATAMFPGGFGIAAEDINCRCAVLQRARWALDKSAVEKVVGNLDGVSDEQLDKWAQKFGVTKDELITMSNGIIEKDGSINHSIKAQSYNEFKKKYQKKEKIEAAKEAAQKEIAEANGIDFDELKKNAVHFDSGYEADEYHKEKNFVKNRWGNELTANERNGIVTYTSNAYREMNSDLRAGRITGTHYEKEIKAATKGLEKTLLAEDTVVFRGMTGGIDDFSIWSGIPKTELSKKSVQESLIGTKLIEKGFMSTGTNAGSAWSGLKLEVYLPKGSQAMYVDPISVFRGEYEILVQRNSTFEIKEIKTDSNGYIRGLVLMLVEQKH